MITASHIRSAVADNSALADVLIAQDLMQETVMTAAATDALADVMKRLAHYRGEVPVMEDGRVLGVIWPEEVIQRYNAEIFKGAMSSHRRHRATQEPRRGSSPPLGRS